MLAGLRRATVVVVVALGALSAPALARADYLDQQNTSSNSTIGVADPYFGQSWTAGVTGHLTRITTPITCTSGGSSSTLKIYSGIQSFYGPALPPPLYTQAVTLSTPGCATSTPTTQDLVLTTPLPILAGSAYTFMLTGQGSTSTIFSNVDVYSGGELYTWPTWDLVFATYTDVPPEIIVNTLADESVVDGNCSLREAIQAANTDAPVDGCSSGHAPPTVDKITFSVTGTITLGSLLPSIAGPTAIGGPGASSLTVSGGGAVRVFSVASTGSLTVGDLTVANGLATGGGVGFWGAGIYNDGGTLTVKKVLFSANHAAQGGGIWNELGTLSVDQSTFTANTSTGGGGAGIFNDQGTLTVTRSTFDGNIAAGDGAGVYNNAGTGSVSNSTFWGNSAGFTGGGILNDRNTFTVVNSTFVGNSASLAGYGGGIRTNGAGGLTIEKNTIVANSPSGGNCSGAMSDGGGNLVYGDSTCPGATANPLFDPAGLADNGGPTKTVALQSGSPAIDAAVAANCPPTDQRGITRPQGAGCDIGAYEFVPPPDTTPPTAALSAPNDGALVSGTVALAGDADDPGAGASGVATWAFEYSADGGGADDTIIASGTTSGAVTASWNTTTLDDGVYDWSLKVVDGAGNITRSAIRSVTIDNSHPDEVLKVDGTGDFTAGSLGTLDPQSPNAFFTPSLQVLDAMCLRLVRHRDAAGAAGFALEPDAAESWTQTDHQFWTFRLRTGLTFSDGAPVTPYTFVRAFERLLSPVLNPGPGVESYFLEIQGAAEYRAGAPTISGIGVDGNILSISLTKPDGGFLAKLAGLPACAVPETTPTSIELAYLPMAGPYFVASFVPGVQLILNDRDNGLGRPHAFKQIVYKLNVSPTTADDEVLSGAADYTTSIAAADESDLNGSVGPDSAAARAGNQQLFIDPTEGVQHLALNAERPLFADVRVRKALNIALDRSALATAFGLHVKLADQFLAEPVPGADDQNIYDPRITDFTVARALVADAGDIGATVQFLGCTSGSPIVQARCDAVDTAVTRSLARIGLNVNITHLPRVQTIQMAATRPFAYDLVQVGWIADYPDPKGMLEPLVDGRSIHDGPNNTNISYFSNATVNAMLDSADALDGADRFDAFGQVDVSAMRDYAPYAPFGTIQNLTLTSTRVQPTEAWYGANLAAFSLRLTPVVGEITKSAAAVPAGAAATPTSAIPVGALSGVHSSTESAPIDEIPIDEIPIDEIDVESSPIDEIPIDEIGFTLNNLVRNGLGGIPLTQIPLVSPLTWDQKLQNTTLAGLPVVDLTLADVVRSAPGVLSTLHLSQIDLSASPIDEIPLASVAMGTVPIDEIPIVDRPGTNTTAQNETDWCGAIHSIPGFENYNCGQLSTETLIGITLQGVPIDEIPIDEIPIDEIDLSQSALDLIALDDVAGNLASSPIDEIPIDEIDFTVSPFASIPLDSLPNLSDVVVCDAHFACAGKTLSDAKLAGKLKPDATIGTLLKYPGITLGNLGKGMDPSITLNDLLALLLPAAAYDWNALPLDFPLNDFASEGGVVTFGVPFHLVGAGGSADVTVAVKLTNGARFVPGSDTFSPAIDHESPVATQNGDTETIRWVVHDLGAGVDETLTFRARAGQVLGMDEATATVSTGGTSVESAPASVAVGDTFEPNDGAAAAKTIASNTLYESYVTSATERDFFTFPNPPAGAIVKAKLLRLPADYDLVMYAPAVPPLRSSPIDEIPIDEIAGGETSPDLQQQSQQVGTETLQDVPTDGAGGGQALAGASSTRGTAPEEIDYVSTGQAGNVTLQVSAYNGDFSATLPYTLLLEIELPPSVPPCQPMSFPNAGSGVAGTMPAIGGNVNTLILTNEKQLGDLYGAAAEQNVVNAANSLIANGYAGTVAALVPLEADPSVAAAYAAFNAEPCSPAKANDVVRAIGTLLDNISSGRPIQNIVILGSDQVVPMARLADPNEIANEASYASTIGYGSNNELLGAAINHMLLSDDPYAAKPTSYNGGVAYIPSFGVSRVVETPTEIVAQINQFNAAKGTLDPKTELVTGYDFLTDGAQATNAVLHAQGRTGSDLINESWTASQFDAAMFASTPPPAEVAPNAHYDNFRLLPADQNAAHLTSNLYTTAQLVAHGAGSTNGRLLFTVGCHSGWQALDLIFGAAAAKSLDWAQAYTGRTGAAGFEGNTGFGYGDTVTVAYSEALQVDFAKRLDGSLNIGRALAFAKQDYWGALGPMFTQYDAKVMGEATEYGIGLYKLGSGSPPPPAAPGPTYTDSATGLTAASFDFDPAFEPHTSAYGNYYTVGGNAFTVNRRPIEPVTFADATQPGLTAHGASFVVKSSSDVTPFDPAFDRLVAASGKTAGEVVGLTTFPTNLVDVRNVELPTGRQQKVVFTPGQFLSDTVPDAAGVGTQRLFNSSSVTVYYSSSRDFAKPDIGPVLVDRVGTGVAGFSVDVTDTDPTGATPQVKAVFVNYLDGATWRKIDLGGNGNHWSGAGPLSTPATSYFLEAIDKNGNVAVVADKGEPAPALAPSAAGAVSATVSGPQTGDWFTGAASVSFSAPQGVSVLYSLDGSMFTPYTGAAVGVSGDGVHTLEYTASDGSHGTLVIPIDTTGPMITINDRSYILGSTGNTFDVRCADAGSGVAICATDPATPDTSTAGAHTVSVHAEDRVGNKADATGTYHVSWPFRGFFDPIKNLPFLNQVNAGKGVPVKFSLNGNRGLSIFAPGSPSSKQIACDSNAPLGTPVTAVASGGSSLTYDAATDTYTYVWKTESAWIGTCRQLDVALADGSHHVANFKFS